MIDLVKLAEEVARFYRHEPLMVEVWEAYLKHKHLPEADLRRKLKSVLNYRHRKLCSTKRPVVEGRMRSAKNESLVELMDALEQVCSTMEEVKIVTLLLQGYDQLYISGEVHLPPWEVSRTVISLRRRLHDVGY